MTRISGFHHLSLSVTDLTRSMAWYTDVLGFTIVADFEAKGFRRARLRHPGAGITLTLTRHEQGSGDRFSELRTGLDHVAFAVPSEAEVEAFKRRFEELEVEHSDIRRPSADATGAAITLRDPDGIQLEVFNVAPRA